MASHQIPMSFDHMMMMKLCLHLSIFVGGSFMLAVFHVILVTITMSTLHVLLLSRNSFIVFVNVFAFVC